MADGHGIPREQAERLAGDVASARALLASAGVDAVEADIVARYQWIDGVVAQVVRPTAEAEKPTLTDRVDGLLMHPFWGLTVFALVMGAVFTSVFKLAQAADGRHPGRPGLARSALDSAPTSRQGRCSRC